MAGKVGQRQKMYYDKPPDKLNKFYVDKNTSFRNKKRIWNKLLQKENKCQI